MTELKDRIDSELENINAILRELPEARKCSALSALELAGVGALIHNFYNGIENILKSIFQFKKFDFPTGANWHRDLLELSLENNVISKNTFEELKPYLAFRHYFSHAYAVDLIPTRIEPLDENLEKVLKNFMNYIGK